MQQKYYFNEVFASERKLLSEFLYYIKVNLAIMKISYKSHEKSPFFLVKSPSSSASEARRLHGFSGGHGLRAQDARGIAAGCAGGMMNHRKNHRNI